MKRMSARWLLIWLCLAGASSWAAAAEKAPVTVFAAASLTNVLQDLGDGFTKETSIPGAILLRGELGSRPADRKWRTCDVFFSADLEWMELPCKRASDPGGQPARRPGQSPGADRFLWPAPSN